MKKARIDELVALLNKCCDEYYNQNNPSLSDAEYDALFDELTRLVAETGYEPADSPTRRPGYEVAGELQKVTHDIPLLSLAKTKSAADVLSMAQASDGYLGLKMDGLTVKLTYENGVLTEAATRGDGAVGELITHTAKTFTNIPLRVPSKEKLCVTGEAYIDIPTFERINEGIDRDEDKFSTPRNLAAGSVRQLDAAVTASRGEKFMPFAVLVGMEDVAERDKRLDKLAAMGFDRIPSVDAGKSDTVESIETKLFALKDLAAKRGLPIDGVVFSYRNADYARSLGRTSHHFRDGIAFKFGDPQKDTVLREIEWGISRSGQLTPVAVFDPCEIDGTTVERASLHNLTFIEDLCLRVGDRVRVSKRNMIIPHIEENYDIYGRDVYAVDYPLFCPACGAQTSVSTTENGGRTVKVLFCSDPRCPGKRVKEFTHFAAKPAMNIEGLSEQTVLRFIRAGLLKELADLFTLPSHGDVIRAMEGFGDKSFENLCASLEKAKACRLSNFLVSLGIPLIGASAARELERAFGDMEHLLLAADGGYDFAVLPDFGKLTGDRLREWLCNEENRAVIRSLLPYLQFEETAAAESTGVFAGKTCVITGSFADYTRDELSDVLRQKGAKVTGSVSKKTDLLLCGEDAGSKLDKAKSLGVRVVFAEELAKLLSE